jgi:hypothetical protein
MNIQRCKFCGCTEDKPCLLTEVTEYAESFIIGTGIQLVPEGAKTRLVPCAWLLEGDLCSAPACVEKAYAEAALLADQLQFFIDRNAEAAA